MQFSGAQEYSLYSLFLCSFSVHWLVFIHWYVLVLYQPERREQFSVW
jgi:hypothetical protein